MRCSVKLRRSQVFRNVLRRSQVFRLWVAPRGYKLRRLEPREERVRYLLAAGRNCGKCLGSVFVSCRLPGL